MQHTFRRLLGKTPIPTQNVAPAQQVINTLVGTLYVCGYRTQQNNLLRLNANESSVMPLNLHFTVTLQRSMCLLQLATSHSDVCP